MPLQLVRKSRAAQRIVACVVIVLGLLIGSNEAHAQPTFGIDFQQVKTGAEINSVGDPFCASDPSPGCDFDVGDGLVKNGD